MSLQCEHGNKVYDFPLTILTTPPIYVEKWICKDCGLKGEDGAFPGGFFECNENDRKWRLKHD